VPLCSGSQDHQSSKNSVQKTICYNSTSNAPDDGRMYPKHVELRLHQLPSSIELEFHFISYERELYLEQVEFLLSSKVQTSNSF